MWGLACFRGPLGRVVSGDGASVASWGSPCRGLLYTSRLLGSATHRTVARDVTREAVFTLMTRGHFFFFFDVCVKI